MLKGVQKEAAIAPALKAYKGVHYINKVQQISRLFQRQREWASWFVLAAYGLIFLLLWLRYGWSLALRVLAPPALAALIVLGVVGFTGQPFHLFHLLALLLVLGIGIDYSIFFGRVHA